MRPGHAIAGAGIGAFTLSLLAAACSAPTADEALSPQADIEATTVVLLPDTQFYACGYPEIFMAQTRWVAQMLEPLAVGLVVHTGDVVDSNVPEQWEVAADALAELNDRVPLLVALGNHDITLSRDSLAAQYIPGLDGGAAGQGIRYREAGSVDNAYTTLRLAGAPWLFIALEFGPRDDVLHWAREVLDAHPQTPTVLLTHAYLYSDGQRYDRRIARAQPFHPDEYGVTAEQGIADGEDIYRALVEPYEQVKLVLSGHVIPEGVARSRSVRDSGAPVHELLANYQHCGACPCPEVQGGNGYLRILEFGDDESIRVSTYSPHLDRWLDDADNSMELRW